MAPTHEYENVPSLQSGVAGRDADVRNWQRYLNVWLNGGTGRTAIGVGGLVEDGRFGPATERATKDFQRAHGLAVDGVVGQWTRVAMDPVLHAAGIRQVAPTSVAPAPAPAGDETVPPLDFSSVHGTSHTETPAAPATAPTPTAAAAAHAAGSPETGQRPLGPADHPGTGSPTAAPDTSPFNPGHGAAPDLTRPGDYEHVTADDQPGDGYYGAVQFDEHGQVIGVGGQAPIPFPMGGPLVTEGVYSLPHPAPAPEAVAVPLSEEQRHGLAHAQSTVPSGAHELQSLTEPGAIVHGVLTILSQANAAVYGGQDWDPTMSQAYYSWSAVTPESGTAEQFQAAAETIALEADNFAQNLGNWQHQNDQIMLSTQGSVALQALAHVALQAHQALHAEH